MVDVTQTCGWHSACGGQTLPDGRLNHNGVDVSPSGGDRRVMVAAWSDGAVVSAYDQILPEGRASDNNGWGNNVVVRYNTSPPLYVNYAHGKDVVVRAGQPVVANMPLLEMGSTGNSTGKHVHIQAALTQSGATGGGGAATISPYDAYRIVTDTSSTYPLPDKMPDTGEGGQAYESGYAGVANSISRTEQFAGLSTRDLVGGAVNPFGLGIKILHDNGTALFMRVVVVLLGFVICIVALSIIGYKPAMQIAGLAVQARTGGMAAKAGGVANATGK